MTHDEKRFKETTDLFMKEIRKVFLGHYRAQKTIEYKFYSAQSFVFACMEQLLQTTAFLEKDFPENERPLSKKLLTLLTEGLSFDVQNQFTLREEKETKNDTRTHDSTHH